jgi:hypothetical protein
MELLEGGKGIRLMVLAYAFGNSSMEIPQEN